MEPVPDRCLHMRCYRRLARHPWNLPDAGRWLLFGLERPRPRHDASPTGSSKAIARLSKGDRKGPVSLPAEKQLHGLADLFCFRGPDTRASGYVSEVGFDRAEFRVGQQVSFCPAVLY
jgi:hypothetical protein